MKTKYLVLAIGILAATSCKKNEDAKPATETSTNLEQKEKILQSDKGSKLSVVYFAEGAEVAVKLKKDGEPEHKLTAKGTSDRGEPQFSDDTYVWELMEDGQSGRLTDKSGTATIYK